MLRNLNRVTNGRRVFGTPYVGLLAEDILAQTASGDHGPGLLHAIASRAEHAGKRLRLRITSGPNSGQLFVRENGAFYLTGAADGLQTIGFDWFVGNTPGGSETASFTVGQINGTAPSVDLHGVSTISTQPATGQANGTAPAVDLHGVSTLTTSPATASSSGDGTAPSVDLHGVSTISTQPATGQANGTAPAVDLHGVSTITTHPATDTTEPPPVFNARYEIREKARRFEV